MKCPSGLILIFHQRKTGIDVEKKELILCEDCVFNNDNLCEWHYGKGYTWVVADDDYCSVGKRRES